MRAVVGMSREATPLPVVQSLSAAGASVAPLIALSSSYSINYVCDSVAWLAPAYYTAIHTCALNEYVRYGFVTNDVACIHLVSQISYIVLKLKLI